MPSYCYISGLSKLMLNKAVLNKHFISRMLKLEHIKSQMIQWIDQLFCQWYANNLDLEIISVAH